MRFRIPSKNPEKNSNESKEIISVRSDQILHFSQCTQQSSYGSDHGIPGVRSNSLYMLKKEFKHVFKVKTLREVNREEDLFYVKNTHSNEWTALEITAAKLAGLTGIAVPYTVYAEGFEKNTAIAESLKNRKDKDTRGEIPAYCVASQRLKGYHDFSTFLDFMSENTEAFFPDEKDRKVFDNKYTKYKELCKRDDSNHAANKLAKCEAAAEIFKIMPTDIKDMMDEMSAISMWLGNWDMFNFDLMNTGFVVRTDEDGAKLVEPAIIDFGNCLAAGFGGQHKRDSFVAANTPAKKQSDNKDNFDPEIKGGDTILKNAASFTAFPGLMLGTVPRRLPFKTMFEDSVADMRTILSDSKNLNGELPHLSHGFLRGLHRVSRVSDEAIKCVVEAWYMPDGLNYLHVDVKKQYSKEEMVGIMKGRRDNLSEAFRQELASYRAGSYGEREILRSQMMRASRDLTGGVKQKEKGFEI